MNNHYLVEKRSEGDDVVAYEEEELQSLIADLHYEAVDEEEKKEFEKIYESIEKGSLSDLKKLEKSIGFKKYNTKENQFLVRALELNHVDIADYLIVEKNVNPYNGKFGYSAISAAVNYQTKQKESEQTFDVIDHLINKYGLDIKKHEHNIVYILVKRNALNFMKKMVEKYNIDINADCSNGLHIAARDGIVGEMFQYLEEKFKEKHGIEWYQHREHAEAIFSYAFRGNETNNDGDKQTFDVIHYELLAYFIRNNVFVGEFFDTEEEKGLENALNLLKHFSQEEIESNEILANLAAETMIAKMSN